MTQLDTITQHTQTRKLFGLIRILPIFYFFRRWRWWWFRILESGAQLRPFPCSELLCHLFTTYVMPQFPHRIRDRASNWRLNCSWYWIMLPTLSLSLSLSLSIYIYIYILEYILRQWTIIYLNCVVTNCVVKKCRISTNSGKITAYGYFMGTAYVV